MELQITTLIENTQDDRGELFFEHGLSLYIEFQGKKLLFDTGQTGEFLKNAQRLGKTIEAVDYIVISHGHYDHSGGVCGLLDYLSNKATIAVDKDKIPIYVGKEFFVPKYKRLPDGTYHYNGNPFFQKDITKGENCPVELRKVDQDMTYLAENIILFKNFKKYNDYEKTNPKFYVELPKEESVCGRGAVLEDSSDNCFRQDEFADEVVLGFVTSKGLVLVVGCSHVGIVNILENVTRRTDLPVYSVLGGTHLVEADEERISRTIIAIEGFGIKEIAVSHCTGEEGTEAVSERFGKKFIRNNTGNVYTI